MAAIATAPGEAGIAIIRVSGPQALRLADAVFKGPGARPSERPTHTLVNGRILGPTGPLDDVLLLIMRAPRSYTGEDTVEIQCHGGQITARRILQLVLDTGWARPAEPGEFTRRAFLNGRMDLLQAEGVLDLIKAQSDRAARAAMEQLEGRPSRVINGIYDQIMAIAADLEATLDFPDDEIPAGAIPDIVRRMHAVEHDLSGLLETWNEGHLLREGALVVISGRPNAGKSTLMNALLGRPRTIVHHTPGTTRDTIEERLVVDGIPVRLVDTAGLRVAEGDIEREGIRRAEEYIQKADLLIYVVDASQPITQYDKERLAGVDPKKVIVVLNKIDLGMKASPSEICCLRTEQASLIHPSGIEAVSAAIVAALSTRSTSFSDSDFSASDRHRDLILHAKNFLNKATEIISSKCESSILLSAIEIRRSAEQIGGITGREYNEALMDSIFSRFCVGK